MSADPVVVLGALMMFLRRHTALDRVPVDALYAPAELVDRLLRLLGIESEPDPLGDLMLACIANSSNARASAGPSTRRAGERCWRCQHGTRPGQCEVCPIREQDEVPPPAWARRSRQRLMVAACRHDSRRPAGRLR